MKRPPVRPALRQLPFHNEAFTWQTFEDFICDFFDAQPSIPLPGGIRRRVESARPYGRKGDRQDGIDIRAEMEGGEIWTFQCKHVERWTPKETQNAISKCTYSAARKFLMVAARRPISEPCRKVVEQHPDWELWDSREISQRFRDPKVLPTLEAARLLGIHFGRGWPEAILGLPGRGALMGTEAMFAPFLEKDRCFHHLLPLVGRTSELQHLDSFVESKRSRVLLLVGPGGIGKSRLLYEWGRGFNGAHPGITLRFLSGTCTELSAELDTEAKPLILVLDDAHRFDDVRRSLFPEIARRKDIKIVLALRPGPTARIRLELADAGFDVSREIDEPRSLERLNLEDALDLADKALGPKLAHLHRLQLRNLSKDCPLLAVLGAYLLQRNELTAASLDNAREFQTYVFDALLRDAARIEDRFGPSPTRDLLELIALLSPVQNNHDFLERASRFIGGAIAAHHVSAMLKDLEAAGLLLVSNIGVRIAPDLLSDHLAYTACYTKGQTRGFAEKVLAHFPADLFPKMLQHLSEAEWRASQASDAADSVVEPLWKWFVRRFEQSCFLDRASQIAQWANIAHFQPRRTIQLANLALGCETAPEPENEFVRESEWNTYQHVIECVPGLLKPVAQAYPAHVAECLDILWQLGRDQLPGILREENHPLVVIRKIASFEAWKSIEVLSAVLDWLERLLRGDVWLTHKNRPGWLLPTLLEPFFATSVDETWSTGRAIHWRSLGVHLDNTAILRKRALDLCQGLVARKSLPVTLGVVAVLEKAIERPRLGGVEEPSKKFRDEWLKERRKALAVMSGIVRDHPAPLVHFRIRKAVQQEFRYGDSDDFCADCRALYDMIPDSLELRVFRAVLGGFHDDFERPIRKASEDEWKLAERRWEIFLTETATAMIARWPDAKILLTTLSEFHDQIEASGLNGSFSHLISVMSKTDPKAAIDCVRALLTWPEHPMADHLDAFLLDATKTDISQRLRFCREAMSSGHESLIVGAIGCFAWWRRESELPKEALEMVQDAAHGASPKVARAVEFYVTANARKAVLTDWDLLVALPTDPSDPALMRRIVATAGELLSTGQCMPNLRLVAKVLKKLDRLKDIEAADVQFALSRIAEKFPAQVLAMYWSRVQKARDPANEKMEPIPHSLRRSLIQLGDVARDPEIIGIRSELETRLLQGPELNFWESRLLEIVVFGLGGDPDETLEKLAENATRPEQIERIESSVKLMDRNIILLCPKFTRKLLCRARVLSPDVHRSVFSTLQHVPGGRSSTNFEPDEDWKGLVENLERMAHQYAADSELGPLYTAAAQIERQGMDDARKRAVEQYAAVDE